MLWLPACLCVRFLQLLRFLVPRNPHRLWQSGPLQTADFIAELKVLTCLDVHSCCKAMKVSTVHAVTAHSLTLRSPVSL